MGRILTNRQVLAAKIEAVEGVAEVLAAADANVQLLQPATFEPNITMFKRSLLDVSLSAFKMIPGTRLAKIMCQVEVKGSGTAGTAPALGKLNKACGLGETVVAVTSVTYKPVSALASIPTLTIAVYVDGVRQQIRGARGNRKYTGKNGEPGIYDYEFIGIYDAVTDVALPTPSGVETTVPVALLTAQFSIAAFSAFISQLSFDLANHLEPRPDINKAEGYISTLLTDREVKGSFDPEMELVATHDFYGRWLAGTTGVLTWRYTGSVGNILVVSAPVCQYTKIAPANRNGIATLGADFLLVRNTTAGDDEFTEVWT